MTTPRTAFGTGQFYGVANVERRLASVRVAHLAATTLVIVADPDEPAIRLYRALGFADTEIQTQLEHVAP